MYIPSQFFNKSKTQVEYLLVGGGGAGGFFPFINNIPNTYSGPSGGGAGAGGFVSGTIDLLLGNAYPIQVALGGIDVGNDAKNGGDTTAFGLTAYGGGSGGEQISLYDAAGPGSGSSGGGGYGNQTTVSGSAIYGSQGKDGGIGANYAFLGGGVYSGGGGGGGASVKGGNAFQSGGNLGKIKAGAGGDGKAWSDGKYYSGGGGGGSWSTSTTSIASAVGGIGGGGQGGSKGFGAAQSGSPNTGGGGGGGEGVRNGGSGIVKVRYPATSISDVKFVGGETTYSSSYIYHTFNSSSVLYTYKPAIIPTPPPVNISASVAVSQSLAALYDILYTQSYPGTGATIYDISGLNNNATIASSSYWNYNTSFIATPTLMKNTGSTDTQIDLPELSATNYTLLLSWYGRNRVFGTFGQGSPLFFDKDQDPGNNQYGMTSLSNDSVGVTIFDSTTPINLNVTSSATLDTWHVSQISLSTTGTGSYCLDGITGSYTGSGAYSALQFSILGDVLNQPTVGYGSGSMFQVAAVYTSSLSTSQMLSNYNVLKDRYPAGPYPPSTTYNTCSCLSYTFTAGPNSSETYTAFGMMDCGSTISGSINIPTSTSKTFCVVSQSAAYFGLTGTGATISFLGTCTTGSCP